MRLTVAICVAVLGVSAVSLRADELPKATPESVGMSSQRLARIGAALKPTSTKARCRAR